MAEKWFARKRFGFGWNPVSLEGWVAFGVYLVGIIVAPVTLLAPPITLVKVIGFGIAMLVWSSLMIRLCIVKGEAPRWQWGRRGK